MCSVSVSHLLPLTSSPHSLFSPPGILSQALLLHQLLPLFCPASKSPVGARKCNCYMVRFQITGSCQAGMNSCWLKLVRLEGIDLKEDGEWGVRGIFYTGCLAVHEINFTWISYCSRAGSSTRSFWVSLFSNPVYIFTPVMIYTS